MHVIKVPSLHSQNNALSNFEANSHFIVKILNNLCDSNDLADQLQYLRNLDVNTLPYCRIQYSGTKCLSHIYESVIRQVVIYAFCNVSIRGVKTYIPEANVLLHHYLR